MHLKMCNKARNHPGFLFTFVPKKSDFELVWHKTGEKTKVFFESVLL